MRRSTSLAAALLAAALLCAALASTALANKLRISNQHIRAAYSAMSFEIGAAEVQCVVTLQGSFHSSTFPKVRELLIGYVTRATHEACVFEGATHLWFLNGAERDLNGNVVANTLPWHIRYESFTGTLPAIEHVITRIVTFSFLVLVIGTSCLYSSTAALPARFEFVRTGAGTISSWTANGTVAIPRAAGNTFLCPASASVRGESEVRLLTTTDLVLITLI